MRVNFARNSYQARSAPLSSQRLVNMFAESAPPDAKSQVSIIGSPGLKSFSTVGTGPIRGMIVMDEVLYVVSGTKVFSVSSDGVATEIGSVGNSGSNVRMAQNGTQILVVEENGDGYIVTSSTSTQITDADFLTAQDVTYQDGFFVLVEQDTGNLFISGLLDGTTYDATDFTNVEENPDDNVGLISAQGKVWVMGQSTTQIYYNSGDADFPFENIVGAFHEIGCISRDSISQIDGVVVWLSDDRIVYRSNGNNIERISTHALEKEFASYSSASDAISFTYTQEGHKFYVLTFPTGDATFIYDFTTGLWHERSTLDTDSRWAANVQAFAYGKNYVGDHRTGKVWELDLDTYKDDTDEIIRLADMPPIFDEYKRITFDKLQIDIDAGTGITTGQGSDPEMMLSWSDDGGITFGTEIKRKIGKKGEYLNRTLFRRLGQSRQRVFRVSISDPVKVCINGAFIDFRVSRS